MKKRIATYRAWKRKYGLPSWAVMVLSVFVFLAVFGDFLANEKPLYCKVGDKSYFPVLRGYIVSTGLAGWPEELLNIDWLNHEFDRVIRAPIPYSAQTIDIHNTNFKGPFEEQDVRRWHFRHWLGTDGLGRDVAAGMLRGARIALFIGIVSMCIAAILGIPLGALIGYTGDRLYLSARDLAIGVIFGGLTGFYLVSGLSALLGRGEHAWPWILLGLAGTLVWWLVNTYLSKRLPEGRRLRVPLDFFVMRGIELFKSIPVFFLLFALLGIVSKASVWNVLAFIALIRWPNIARYVRAEALRIREQPYILAARGLGLQPRQIIWRHVIPNALGPVFVTLAFGVGSAVLIESGLSFLGIGIPIDEMSWGKLLSEARKNFSAWWLAVFPGLAIFLVISSFHAIGDSLQKFYQPKMQ